MLTIEHSRSAILTVGVPSPTQSGFDPAKKQDNSARALMPGTGLTTAWHDLGCPAAMASDEGRSHG
jgi:hypothetical protein